MKRKYILLLLITWSCSVFAETAPTSLVANEAVVVETTEPAQSATQDKIKKVSNEGGEQDKTTPIPLTRPFTGTIGGQTQKAGVVGVEDFFTTFLALMFILILIAFMTWILKRSGLVVGKGGQVIKILATAPVGSKEKLALIEVGEQQVLIGITANQINKIMTLTEAVDIEENISTRTSPAFFNTLLKQKNV